MASRSRLSGCEPHSADARADAIRNYTMTRTKRDYMKRLGDLGYLGLDEKGTTVTQGFEYSSGTNTYFLNTAEIRMYNKRAKL